MNVTTSKRPVLLALILLLMAICIFASDSYLPSMPSIQQSLVASHSAVKLTLAVYLLGMAIGPLICGPLTDHYGRRPILLLALAVAVMGSIVCVFAKSIQILILGRLIQSLGTGGIKCLGRTILSDLYKREARARISSYLGLIISTFVCLAPIVGGYIQAAFGWRANFVLLLALMLLSWLLTWLFIPETKQQLTCEKVRLAHAFAKYRSLITNWHFLCFPILTGLSFSGIMAYSTLAPFLFQKILSLSPIHFGWLSIIITCSIIIGALTNILLLKYITIVRAIFYASIFELMAALLMLALGLAGQLNIWAILLPIALFNIAANTLFSNSYASGIHLAQQTPGAGTAIYSSMQVLLAGLVSTLASFVLQHNQLPLAYIFVGIGILALVVATMIQRHEQKETEDSSIA